MEHCFDFQFDPSLLLKEKTPKKGPLTKVSFSHSLVQNTTYASKKRLFAPLWWIEGIALSLGSKEAWFEHLVKHKSSSVIAVPEGITAKNAVIFISIWHELIGCFFSQNFKQNSLRVDISRSISGTSLQIKENCQQIEKTFCQPLSLCEFKPSKRAKSGFSSSKKGTLNLVHQAYIEREDSHIWLYLTFTKSVHDFFCPQQIFKQENMPSRFVSINPVVIQAMGARAPLKRVMTYFAFEILKQRPILENSLWNQFKISLKAMSTFHKDIIASAPSFYDHGVLGWSNSAPNIKISDLKKALQKKENQEAEEHSHILCTWVLSDQGNEALKIEQAVNSKFMSIDNNTVTERPATSVPVVQKKIPYLSKELERKKKQEPSILQLHDSLNFVSKKYSPQTQQPFVPPQVPHLSESGKFYLNETEFMVLVAEFYESLKPIQKRAFEKDRRGMSSEEFKAYMIPILKRKKLGKCGILT